jgi:hypothetical protein
MAMKESSKAAGWQDDNGWSPAVAGVIVSLLLFVLAPRGEAPSDAELSLELTVVPNDRTTLSCDSAAPIGGLQCTHAGGSPVASDRPLRPYVTTGRELVLLSGVFEAPAVSNWVEASQRSGHKDRKTLRCRVIPLTQSASAGVRFKASGAFSLENQLMAGKVITCEVE